MHHVSASPESSTQTRNASQFVCDVRFRVRGSAWIHLAGELDIGRAAEFERELDRALSAARLVVVDLRRRTFMDSAGVHVIGRAHARVRPIGRRLVIVRGPEQIDRLLDLAKLTDRLTLVTLKPQSDLPVVSRDLCGEAASRHMRSHYVLHAAHEPDPRGLGQAGLPSQRLAIVPTDFAI